MEQRFSGNPVNRSVGDRKSETFLKSCLAKVDTQYLLYKRGKVLFKSISEGEELKLALFDVQQCVKILGLSSAESISSLFCIVLGQLEERWLVCIEVPCTELLHIDGYTFVGPPSLVASCSHPDAAIVGHVLALQSWHAECKYLSSTGEVTESVEGGFKRRSISANPVTIYPRVNPVVIACVINSDGSKCLLGKMRRYPPGMFSCLSGFLEPCESVQEAVRREVFEESGVTIGEVQLVDSQPWPIPRSGGSCEIMLACVAQALTDEIIVTQTEVDVEIVEWFNREEVKEMLLAGSRLKPPSAPRAVVSSNTSISSNSTDTCRSSVNKKRLTSQVSTNDRDVGLTAPISGNPPNSSQSSTRNSSGDSVEEESELTSKESSGRGAHSKSPSKVRLPVVVIPTDDTKRRFLPGSYAIAHHLCLAFVNGYYGIDGTVTGNSLFARNFLKCQCNSRTDEMYSSPMSRIGDSAVLHSSGGEEGPALVTEQSDKSHVSETADEDKAEEGTSFSNNIVSTSATLALGIGLGFAINLLQRRNH